MKTISLAHLQAAHACRGAQKKFLEICQIYNNSCDAPQEMEVTVERAIVHRSELDFTWACYDLLAAHPKVQEDTLRRATQLLTPWRTAYDEASDAFYRRYADEDTHETRMLAMAKDATRAAFEEAISHVWALCFAEAWLGLPEPEAVAPFGELKEQGDDESPECHPSEQPNPSPVSEDERNGCGQSS